MMPLFTQKHVWISLHMYLYIACTDIILFYSVQFVHVFLEKKTKLQIALLH